jgi:hypothetical protein
MDANENIPVNASEHRVGFLSRDDSEHILGDLLEFGGVEARKNSFRQNGSAHLVFGRAYGSNEWKHVRPVQALGDAKVILGLEPVDG